MLGLLKEKRLVPGLTGVEMRADGVSVVRVVREPGRPPLVTLCDFRPWGSADNKAQVLAKLAADYDLKRSRCATVLDQDEYTLLLTEAPDVPAEELRSAIRWRIKDLIDFHVDDATLDVFDVTTPNSTGKNKSMYVVAARNEAIQRRVDLCDGAGINLDVIDIPEMAQRNLAAILPEDVRGVVILSFTATHGLVTITRQGEIYLSRRVDIGLDALRQAEDRTNYFDNIVLEIQRSLDYYDSHFRQPPVGHLTVSSSAKDVDGLLDYLNQNLNIKASVMDLGPVLKYEVDGGAMLHDEALIALGAALRHEEKAL